MRCTLFVTTGTPARQQIPKYAQYHTGCSLGGQAQRGVGEVSAFWYDLDPGEESLVVGIHHQQGKIFKVMYM